MTKTEHVYLSFFSLRTLESMMKSAWIRLVHNLCGGIFVQFISCWFRKVNKRRRFLVVCHQSWRGIQCIQFDDLTFLLFNMLVIQCEWSYKVAIFFEKFTFFLLSTMKSRSDRVVCAVQLNFILTLCILIASTNALDTGVGTVAPLLADNPVSTEKIDHKDVKKFDSSYNEPPPEYYK